MTKEFTMITTTPASAAARVLHRVLSRQRTRDRPRSVADERDTMQPSNGVAPTAPSAKWLALG